MHLCCAFYFCPQRRLILDRLAMDAVIKSAMFDETILRPCLEGFNQLGKGVDSKLIINGQMDG